jgi:cell division protein FtsW
MASRVVVAPSAHLRLVRTGGPTASRPDAALATRRTVAMLLGATGFLVAGGLIMVLSASSISAFARFGDGFLFFERQAGYAVVGVLALLATARMRYRAWRKLSVPLLGVTVVALALVLHPAAGVRAYGSSRWISVGPVAVQPSELAKLALIVFAAAILSRGWRPEQELRRLLLPLGPVVSLVCGMVMFQPDLGTTVILAGSVFLLLFAAGGRLRYLLTGAVVATTAGFGLIMSADYRRVRFLSFLHPWADARDAGYQLAQSLIALGSGGWTGVGLGASRQKWMYVPNAHTDFIFAILGEELGLIGEIAVLVAFGVLLYAGTRVAVRAADPFGRLLAAGIVSWFGLQVVVNLGAVTGLLPITGVPLPFLSYGGSSLVVSLAAVGILLSIARSPAGEGARGRGRSGRAGGPGPRTRGDGRR